MNASTFGLSAMFVGTEQDPVEAGLASLDGELEVHRIGAGSIGRHEHEHNEARIPSIRSELSDTGRDIRDRDQRLVSPSPPSRRQDRYGDQHTRQDDEQPHLLLDASIFEFFSRGPTTTATTASWPSKRNRPAEDGLI